MNAALVPCAICGEMQTRRIYTKGGYEIGRCVRCGLVHASPRAPRDRIVARYSPSYFWDEYLPALGVNGGTYDLSLFDVRYAPLLDLLRPASGRRLLEIGCGAGFFLKCAERRGWRVTGIELADEPSRFGRERLGLDIRREAAESMSVAPDSFDAAVMFDTIEHLFDPRAVLETTARALVNGGTMLIATPNFSALSRYLLGPPWAVLSPLEHLYHFEERTLEQLLVACGFCDVRFIRRHPWTPQETMNFVNTHAPRGARARLAALIGRVGGGTLSRAIQRAGRQDILLCLSRRSGV